MDTYSSDAPYEDGDGGVGNRVIDEEKVTGAHAEGFPEDIHAAVAHKVQDGKITLARILT